MRPRKPDRVVGLYDEGEKCRIKWVEQGHPRSLLLPNRPEAERMARKLAAQFPSETMRTVADLIEQWAADKIRTSRCKSQSVEHQRGRLRSFLESCLTEEVSSVSLKRAEALYRVAVESPTRKTGKPPSAATHRFDLWTARHCFDWAVAHGWVSKNPFSAVKPVGKVRVGKQQLRLGEARRFTREAVRYFNESGHPLAVGALLALSMGLRTGEVLDRVVRDVDEGACYLWIDSGKTDNARRHLEVPVPLRSLLLRLCEGKAPDALLFPSRQTGQRYPHQTMHRVVGELCRRADVPRVCTHSLRGLYATLAVQSGAASHVVAASLGHHSFEVTQRHYAQPCAVANASTARVAELLTEPSSNLPESFRSPIGPTFPVENPQRDS